MVISPWMCRGKPLIFWDVAERKLLIPWYPHSVTLANTSSFDYFFAYIGLLVLNWPIRVYVIERIYSWPILLSSSNRKYPPFPLLSYFSVVVCLRGLYYHILSSITYISWEHWDLVYIIDDLSMVFANDRIHYGLQVVFVCLQITPSHYHHYVDLSEGIELLKCLSGVCCRVLVWD